jgi:hypothetical protein
MKVWVTKYALSIGIRECEVVDDEGDGMVKVHWTDKTDQWFHRSDWHRTRQDAYDKAEQMRATKIESLRKQIEKLQALDLMP